MKRHHIIPLVILGLVLAAFGAVYQFYIKQLLQEYAENRAYLDSLNARVAQLETTFQGASGAPVKPDEVVQQWRAAAEPFRDQITRQARFFNYGSFMEFNQVPEGQIPKFYYMNERKRLEDELLQYAAQRGTDIADLDKSFGVPASDAVNRANPPDTDVNKWLQQYNFGDRMTRMLIDAGATKIVGVAIWPPRREHGLLNVRTVGLQFEMSIDNLAKFLRQIMEQERFFKVEALSVNNADLLIASEPRLKVDMLLAQGVYIEGQPGQPAAVAAAAPTDVLQQLRQGVATSFSLRSDDLEEPEIYWYTGILRFFGF